MAKAAFFDPGSGGFFGNDGALVGGASLIVDEFNEIIMAAQDVSK